ncbi:hypothetical protein ACWCP6_15085 [Streptomyces sp. NPDC002004]
MRSRGKNRLITFLTTSALLAGASLTFGANNAAAADFTFEKGKLWDDGSFTVVAYNNGKYAGLAEWNADPGVDAPGDALRAVDPLADGWGVEAHLLDPSRVASTRGHDARYISPWKSGDIPEGTKVWVRLCMVKGDLEDCTIFYSGHA